jgi:hypothetical protein
LFFHLCSFLIKGEQEFGDTYNFSGNYSGSQQNTCIPLGVRHAQFEGILHGVTSRVEVKGWKVKYFIYETT